MHILVVEDDVALARQIASALTEAGHDPVVVHDGENALGRRYPEEPVLKLRVGDLTLDLASHEVHRGLRHIHLSARELMLLKVLMREPGRVFTRTELCERVWEHPHEYDTKLVEVFIGRLRRKISDPPLIHTVRHVGYTIDSRDRR